MFRPKLRPGRDGQLAPQRSNSLDVLKGFRIRLRALDERLESGFRGSYEVHYSWDQVREHADEVGPVEPCPEHGPDCALNIKYIGGTVRRVWIQGGPAHSEDAMTKHD